MKIQFNLFQARMFCAVALGIASLSSAAAEAISDANWTSLASTQGANGFVRTAVVDGSGNLYIGGAFTVVGGVNANRIAKWNGKSWSALGSGMDNDVWALAVSGSNLYAGGFFTTAGGKAANLIARWDGSSWSPLAKQINDGSGGIIYALAVLGGDLWVGGSSFSVPPFPGGAGQTTLAKYDGTNWLRFNSSVVGGTRALAVAGSNLYAGGNTPYVAGIPANYIAKWDGTNWSSLGSGLDAGVVALAVSGSDLYVGGQFTTAGGSPSPYIAKWDGTDWSVPASGMNDAVWSLAVSGSDLYAGGRFTNASGAAANYIARWDGSNWSSLGSGMDHQVYALAVSGSDLYVGGRFTTAGGKASPCVGRAYLLTLPTLSIFSFGTQVSVSWPSADAAGFALEETGALAAPVTWVTNAASVTDDGTNKSVVFPATNSGQFFRLRRP